MFGKENAVLLDWTPTFLYGLVCGAYRGPKTVLINCYSKNTDFENCMKFQGIFPIAQNVKTLIQNWEIFVEKHAVIPILSPMCFLVDLVRDFGRLKLTFGH